MGFLTWIKFRLWLIKVENYIESEINYRPISLWKDWFNSGMTVEQAVKLHYETE